VKVELVGRPVFCGVPEKLGYPRLDQLQGTDAEKIIETAGRTCYDSFGQGRDSEGYAQHILEVNHTSVLEHAQYTFFITGVSRGLTHEHVRHRIGVGISQRSTRYVDEDNSPWITHPLLKSYMENTHGVDLEDTIKVAIARCRDAYSLEGMLSSIGVDKLTARKQARGAARGFLGNALQTEMVWSANIRALRNYLDQRANPAADAEIRALAYAIWEIMVKEVPAYFSDYEPIECPDGLPGGLKSKYGRV